MTRRRGISGGLLAVIAIGALIIVGWKAPAPDATGGACDGQTGARTPITWVIVDKENGNTGSPMHITDVSVTPANFGITAFSPNPVANDGVSESHATTNVPVDFAGDVTLTFSVHWSGTSGSDSQGPFYVTTHVSKCQQPTTTTTQIVTTSSSTSTSTSTTIIVTTTSTTATTVTTPTTENPCDHKTPEQTLPPDCLPPTTPTTVCDTGGGFGTCDTTTTAKPIECVDDGNTTVVTDKNGVVTGCISQVTVTAPAAPVVDVTPAFTG